MCPEGTVLKYRQDLKSECRCGKRSLQPDRGDERKHGTEVWPTRAFDWSVEKAPGAGTEGEAIQF